MPRLFRDLLVLVLLIMTASCFDATDDVTTTAEMLRTTSTSFGPTTIAVETNVSSSTLPARNESIPEVVSSSPSPSTSPAKNESIPEVVSSSPLPSTFFDAAWECPNITKPGVECSCDFPHTLRCAGDRTALQSISKHLKHSRPDTISLLDVTVTGISLLPARFLENVALHGLVVSTGELKYVHADAFTALARPLQALGLPNNLLDSVPTSALSHLVGLDRLDLSHNKLKTLEADSFKGLSNLTHLDLCNNLLSQLSPQAFLALPGLRSLRMRGNRLSVSALSALRGLKRLEELDLSNNLLLGSMSPNLLPQMPRLHFLTVSENSFVNVKQEALMGLKNLTYLSLSHNQIDVVEDHSFKHLSNLTQLDLANNRIVAVSSASLAHLDKLTTLDLTHNFLRTLSADLVVPLKSLQDLRLDDNDITIVASDVPMSKLHLKRLSLADNPLNCDCTLLEFANWLANSSLMEEDKSSAVCATPPALENGILTQVPSGSLLCGEPTPSLVSQPSLAGAQLSLKEFHYDQSTGVNLLWHVEQCTERYTCDSLIVYETIGDSEVQTESSPLHCDSQMMRDPCTLPVAVSTASLHLELGHKYRYCVVLLIPTVYDDVSLGLGCSDVIALKETQRQDPSYVPDADSQLPHETSAQAPIDAYSQITGVHVNVSDNGYLHVNVILSGMKETTVVSSPTVCHLSVVVFDAISTIHRQRLNCNSSTFVTDVEVSLPGYYKVCASLNELDDGELVASSELANDHERSRCVEVVKQDRSGERNAEVYIVSAVIATTGVLVLLIVLCRNLVKRLRHPRIQAQCFLPTQEFEITHKAHYIKLLATTKV
ncbi:slit homolog 2 protein-like isoform X2 [Pseudomyrmex gracilis]|nr:slit homolog 2 protein-like isoform X2 [Pseudomyrmex gracilis]